ncbi:MAG: hypothetical protein GDA45_07560 [Chromatiales bacterium]|nr:hypothetical protein [Chromatiales bacterium]
MKKLLAAAALAATFSGAALAEVPAPSKGLFVLATTGWADLYAEEIGGLAFDNTGGKPGAFEYAVPVNLEPAKALLNEGEFLAPHFAISLEDKSVTIMVAPHLKVGDKVFKGENEYKDHFIVINGEEATRYDYSKDVRGLDS